MKSSPCFISMIPDYILLEILNFLPFESLHKCRWVSRSWHSLITYELFPKIIKSQFLGFFHRIGAHSDAFSYIERGTDDDPGLDFLPCAAPTLTLLDRCNGLILYQAWELDAYYVCNPVNSLWTMVKGCGFTPKLILLDFDPWVSPYFMLVAFAVRPTSVLVSMYCSETKRWAEISSRYAKETGS